MNQQLALAIQLNDEAILQDFNWGSNQLLKNFIEILVKNSTEMQLLYIWGPPGSGKSHLLQACCQAVPLSTIYLPLKLLKEFDPEILEGIESHSLICIDDIETIAKNPAWEEALFHLYNKIRDQASHSLIISGCIPPMNTELLLPDLKSRLSWGMVMQLEDLHDDEKIVTLQHHAKKRGFDLPSGVIQFLFNRCSRNMHDLQEILDQLDKVSLAAQRKITIPFVKEVLSL